MRIDYKDKVGRNIDLFLDSSFFCRLFNQHFEATWLYMYCLYPSYFLLSFLTSEILEFFFSAEVEPPPEEGL